MNASEGRRPSFMEAAVLLIICAGLISYGVLKLGADAHIPIILSAVLVSLWGAFVLKFPWQSIEEGIIQGITMALQAILILMMVGLVIGSWIQSGVVPSLIYYGLDILSPKIFLLATLVICAVVALATGTSWGTSGTVGIALMGVGAGLGIPAPVTAGIIISGAYFGDKMSPLSDTTNLAPAVAGTDLFTHIRAMIWTTGPTFLIVAAITIFLGNKYSGGTLDISKIQAIQAVMAGEFHISLMGLVPPLIVIGLAVAKIPALPGLFAGILFACGMSLFQGFGFGDVIGALHYGYEATVSGQIAAAETIDAVSQLMAQGSITGVSPELAKDAGVMLSDLLTRGGLDSMMWTISLILSALSFGGIMERCGFLEVLLQTILKGVKSVGGMVTSVLASCFICNLFLGDQYLSIVMPGRMFKNAFEEKGLHAKMLSRTLEDAGTLTSVLIPWNTCGAYNASVLGVPTLEYLPYAFMNYLNPIVAIVMTYLNIGVFWQEGKEPKKA
ncbi:MULTISPECIES: Na+/H+ antiporter NhaC [Dethiosulfovibrio]|uniref:Na+/H+ antiporter NhaC n=3 Tax=Dethiosulfovibrio TaxID=47054 RepID=D2Z5Z1_9BACT|nr:MULTISPECIES: Na+/H+ antiporter NhaC [Dethiosulfovibrio]EFC90888.1 Na+/H+ antiporter NhaC [Dethiosulfovibrio peptidovorans DSM 11002]MCF4113244.1 Na+/H+ antiporter NhaC [Dethiosulfovibrio russensis]MCF4142308.1 Na+/H+ antiporter NhaC [Dethiosulfovibrio marinus]MCF4144616.1 Na+/H+ antiporter NhaC [Dethiosulfovibrio acidaminovorans]